MLLISHYLPDGYLSSYSSIIYGRCYIFFFALPRRIHYLHFLLRLFFHKISLSLCHTPIIIVSIIISFSFFVFFAMYFILAAHYFIALRHAYYVCLCPSSFSLYMKYMSPPIDCLFRWLFDACRHYFIALHYFFIALFWWLLHSGCLCHFTFDIFTPSLSPSLSFFFSARFFMPYALTSPPCLFCVTPITLVYAFIFEFIFSLFFSELSFDTLRHQ